MASSTNKTVKTAKNPAIPDRRDPVTKDHIPLVAPDVPEPTPEELTAGGSNVKSGSDKDIEVEFEGADVIVKIGTQKIRLDKNQQIRFGKVFARASAQG